MSVSNSVGTPGRQLLRIPLLSAAIDGEATVVHDQRYTIRFSRITEEQRRRWLDSQEISWLTKEAPSLLKRASTAIEVRGNLADMRLGSSQIAEDLYTLFALVDIRLPHFLWAPFSELAIERHGETRYVVQRVQETERIGDMAVFPNLSDSSGAFQKYWSLLTTPERSHIRLRRALGRAFRARRSWFLEDSLIDAWIGLETLFSRSDEKRHYERRLSKRITEFLRNQEATPNLIDQLRLAHRVSRSYAARSDLIHGALIDKRLRRAAEDARGVLPTVIEVCLESGLNRLSTDNALGKLVQEFDAIELQLRRERKKRRIKRTPRHGS